MRNKAKRAVTLDLRKLRFVDSTGLRLILEIDAMARRDGFNFAVVRGPETVQRIFAITGMEDRLVFVDAPEDLAPAALAVPAAGAAGTRRTATVAGTKRK